MTLQATTAREAAHRRPGGVDAVRRACLADGAKGILGWSLGMAAVATMAGTAHATSGAVGQPATAGATLPQWLARPQPCPTLDVLWTDEQREALPSRLKGSVTAVQLMFSGCTDTCGAQGMLFGHMAERTVSWGVQWVSISIDTLGDHPARLRAWQQRFGAHATWQAAVPRPQDVEALNGFLRGFAPKPGTHSNQVFLFDRKARLRCRTGDDPSPRHLAEQLITLLRTA
jgi:protein SCO1